LVELELDDPAVAEELFVCLAEPPPVLQLVAPSCVEVALELAD
jgi:hypothetical protein